MTSERRRWRWKVAAASGALVAAALLGGCADFSRGPAAPAPDAAADAAGGEVAAAGDGGAPLSFAAAVYPLLVPTCQRCHAPGQQAGDTQLLFAGDPAADYATVLTFVDTAAPASSRLLHKMNGEGHGGGTVYAAGSPEYETVLTWIEQGARP
jgi:hypothetical protein